MNKFVYCRKRHLRASIRARTSGPNSPTTQRVNQPAHFRFILYLLCLSLLSFAVSLMSMSPLHLLISLSPLVDLLVEESTKELRALSVNQIIIRVTDDQKPGNFLEYLHSLLIVPFSHLLFWWLQISKWLRCSCQCGTTRCLRVCSLQSSVRGKRESKTENTHFLILFLFYFRFDVPFSLAPARALAIRKNGRGKDRGRTEWQRDTQTDRVL